MFRCDVLNLLFLEGCTAQDFISYQRVEHLDNFDSFVAGVGGQTLKLSCQSDVLK